MVLQVGPLGALLFNLFVEFVHGELPHNADATLVLYDQRESFRFVLEHLVHVGLADLPEILLGVHEFIVVAHLVQHQYRLLQPCIDHVRVLLLEVEGPERVQFGCGGIGHRFPKLVCIGTLASCV